MLKVGGGLKKDRSGPCLFEETHTHTVWGCTAPNPRTTPLFCARLSSAEVNTASSSKSNGANVHYFFSPVDSLSRGGRLRAIRPPARIALPSQSDARLHLLPQLSSSAATCRTVATTAPASRAVCAECPLPRLRVCQAVDCPLLPLRAQVSSELTPLPSRHADRTGLRPASRVASLRRLHQQSRQHPPTRT